MLPQERQQPTGPSDASTSTPPASAQDAPITVAAPTAAAAVAAPQPKSYDVDSVIRSLQRTPLFMTSLSDIDPSEDPESHAALEGLKALAYEGTRAEVAANFREQGNERAREKGWGDAREYYSRALAALRGPRWPSQQQVGAGEEKGGGRGQDGDGEPEVELTAGEEVDEEAEAKREREIEEACYINRALCNLELKNYRACTLDCASTLKLNPHNVKAWYRSASACVALDKIPEAEDACARGLEVEPKNTALKLLQEKIQKRKTHLEEVERKRQEREARERAEEVTLKLALKNRKYIARSTDAAPNMEDASLKLTDPLNAESDLLVPVLLLYPLHAQSDFIKAFSERDPLAEHLAYIFADPLPWDEEREYSADVVECYMETLERGLIKVGKKLPLSKILASGKVEIVDGLVRVYVVPKDRAKEWIEEFKIKRPAQP